MNKLDKLKEENRTAVNEIKLAIRDSARLQNILYNIMVALIVIYSVTILIIFLLDFGFGFKLLIILGNSLAFSILLLILYTVKVITRQLNSNILISALEYENENK
jgi:hypothetical protein